MQWLPWALLAGVLYASLAALTYAWYRRRERSLPAALLASAEVDLDGGCCAHCGAENATEFRYCHNCASRLSAGV